MDQLATAAAKEPSDSIIISDDESAINELSSDDEDEADRSKRKSLVLWSMQQQMKRQQSSTAAAAAAHARNDRGGAKPRAYSMHPCVVSDNGGSCRGLLSQNEASSAFLSTSDSQLCRRYSEQSGASSERGSVLLMPSDSSSFIHSQRHSRANDDVTANPCHEDVDIAKPKVTHFLGKSLSKSETDCQGTDSTVECGSTGSTSINRTLASSATCLDNRVQDDSIGGSKSDTSLVHLNQQASQLTTGATVLCKTSQRRHHIRHIWSKFRRHTSDYNQGRKASGRQTDSRDEDASQGHNGNGVIVPTIIIKPTSVENDSDSSL